MPGYARRLKLVERIWPNSPSSGKSFSVTANLSARELAHRMPDLARQYTTEIEHQGSDWFSSRAFCSCVEKWMKRKRRSPQLEDDFPIQYKIELREPIITSYRDFKSRAFRHPVPAACLSPRILNILENF